MRLLDLLELPLPISQETAVVDAEHVVDLLLLILYVVVRPFLLLECALHALHNSMLRVPPTLVESHPISHFRFVLVVPQFLQVAEVRGLCIVDVVHELLPPLQVPDAFVRALLLLLQLQDSVLDLRFLVLLPLRRVDRVHHEVVLLLPGN